MSRAVIMTPDTHALSKHSLRSFPCEPGVDIMKDGMKDGIVWREVLPGHGSNSRRLSVL